MITCTAAAARQLRNEGLIGRDIPLRGDVPANELTPPNHGKDIEIGFELMPQQAGYLAEAPFTGQRRTQSLAASRCRSDGTLFSTSWALSKL